MDRENKETTPAAENAVSNSQIPAPPKPPAAAPLDLDKILLPKNEVPGTTPQSAQRINAGALLAQEQKAAIEGIPDEPVVFEKVLAPEPEPAPVPKEQPSVQPLETYKSDIEKIVQQKNVSLVTIAAAEAERRASSGESVAKAEPGRTRFMLNLLMISIGVLLLVAASGVLAYFFIKPGAAQQAAAVPQAPFVSVDGQQTVVIPAGETNRDAIMQSLTSAKNATALSLGLISQLYVSTPTTTQSSNTLEEIDPQTLLQLLAPDVPQELLLALNPQYLLGVHVYDGNQPFFMFDVNSYEQAYAGMLAWEPTMETDLSPLFINMPEQPPAGFVDQIVDNDDARVIEDQSGNIVLLWTFINRDTLVITTNEATLREIISRLQNAPVVAQPGQ